jgi:hypothetical protein
MGHGFLDVRREERDKELDKSKKILECKDWAINAEKIGGLVAVRGYALFDLIDNPYSNPDIITGKFTEHWWCVDNTGSVIDPTGLSLISERLVPLKDQSDESFCLSYNGACEYNPICGWCRTRYALENYQYKRLSMRPIRGLLDYLMREQVRLRQEIESLRQEIRSKC